MSLDKVYLLYAIDREIIISTGIILLHIEGYNFYLELSLTAYVYIGLNIIMRDKGKPRFKLAVRFSEADYQ